MKQIKEEVILKVVDFLNITFFYLIFTRVKFDWLLKISRAYHVVGIRVTNFLEKGCDYVTCDCFCPKEEIWNFFKVDAV